VFWPYRTGGMQDSASELRRIPLPRTRVNKGQKDAWLCGNIGGGFAHGGDGEALGLALGLAVVAAPLLGTAVSPVVSRSLRPSSSCPPVGSGTVEGFVPSSVSEVGSVEGSGSTVVAW
jgi:hypothetical protein